MKKYWKIISLFLVTFILITFLIYGINKKYEKNTLSEKIKKCPDTYDNYKDANCVTSLAIEYKNESICENIAPTGGSLGWGEGHECILQTYIAIGDKINCDKLRFFSDKCKEEIEKIK